MGFMIYAVMAILFSRNMTTPKMLNSIQRKGYKVGYAMKSENLNPYLYGIHKGEWLLGYRLGRQAAKNDQCCKENQQ